MAWAEVGYATVRHQEDLMEHGEQLGARLVDGADDGLASGGERLESLDDGGGTEGVEAGGGLVTEQKGRVGQTGGRERQALPLAT